MSVIHVPAKASGHHMTKQDAGYTDFAKTSREYCALCTMFRKSFRCTLVNGTIAPGGVCRYFVRREMPKGGNEAA
jgi:hypothetical protein